METLDGKGESEVFAETEFTLLMNVPLVLVETEIAKISQLLYLPRRRMYCCFHSIAEVIHDIRI